MGRIRAAPTAENVPFLSLRASAHTGVAIRISRPPFFNVFRWQFENSDIFNFQLSILNSPGAGCGTRTAESRPYGRPGRSACGEQCSPLRAGCGGRGVRPADCRRYRRAGEHGRLRAVPTGARGGVHVANNVRRYGRAAAGGARGRQIAGATGGRGERGRLRAVPTGGQAGGDADGCGKWISRISVCVRFCVLSCVPSYVLSYVLLCVLLYRCARRLKGLQLRKNYQKNILIRISVGISFPFLPGFSRFLHISGKTGQTIASKTPKH